MVVANTLKFDQVTYMCTTQMKRPLSSVCTIAHSNSQPSAQNHYSIASKDLSTVWAYPTVLYPVFSIGGI